MSARDQTRERLFNAAVELKTPAQRAAFLDAACAGDQQLRADIEELLRHDAAAGSFLEHAIADEDGTGDFINQDSSRSAESADHTGVSIGSYKLLQKLGEGGMGEVWAAEQTEPVKRRVALKLIKSGMDSTHVIRRFEAERQALAMMDHANIAKVFDAGTTPDRRPYFVMELVKGIPITTFCDQEHLSPRERLDLFIPVCHAVQHAHQKGIIHRDLKPSNVMIALYDGKPIPKVIDFGVAKATAHKLTEQTMYTEVGQIVGTLEYMSPEQAELNNLDIDTRSDIYALGVILYELLTGSRPFDAKRLRSAAFAEMLRIIREEEPQRPSTRLSQSGDALPSISAQRKMEPKKLSRLLQGDLDWIVMKALAKERNRRYDTANGFAMDIQRYLADEPVLAGPPGPGYRLRKFVRRNQGGVIAASLIGTALVAGLICTTWQWQRALAARQAEAEQRKEAEKANLQAFEALRSFTDELMEKQFASKTELSENEKSILRSALKQWEGFAQSKGESPDARSVRAEGAHRVALVQQKLGLNVEAESNYRAAIAIADKLAIDYPAVPAYEESLATNHNNLGALLDNLGKREEARTEFQTARDLFKKLVAQFPAEAEYQQGLAAAHNNLGPLLAVLGIADEARVQLQAARDIRKKLLEQFPNVPTYQYGLAATHNNLGGLFAGIGNREEARAEYQVARDIQKKLVELFPAIPVYQQELAVTHNNLGNLLAELGQWEEARAEYQAARDLRKTLVERFPSVPGYQHDLTITHSALGSLLAALGKREEARVEYQAARDIQRKLVEQVPAAHDCQKNLAITHGSLGLLLFDLGKFDEARAEYQAARDIQKKLVDQDPTVPVYQQHLANTHNCLGVVLARLGKREEARAEGVAARHVQKRLVEQFPAVPAYQIELGGSYCNYGCLLRDEGEPAESLEWFDLAIRTLKPVHDKEPRDAAAKEFLQITHGNRARAHDRLGKPAEAIKDWDRAIDLSPPTDRPAFHASRATSLIQAGMVAEAVAEVAELTKSSNWNAGQWYDFACVYAVANGKVANKKQEYADRAMELLQRAVKADYKDAAHMKKDTDLDPLREREDFKKLIAALEASTAAEKPHSKKS